VVIPTPITSEEDKRLAAVRRYGVLDTPPEGALDKITELAAAVCHTPIALISVVDEQRQWFKSKVGFSASETARDVSFCHHALQGPGLFVVPDASLDSRFADNPMVTGDPQIRFYAGMPLVMPTGEAIGTLCVFDRRPRKLTKTQEQVLRVLAEQVVTHLELGLQSRKRAWSERLLKTVTDSARVGLMLVNKERRYVRVNDVRAGFYNSLSPAIVGHRVQDTLPDIYEQQIRPWLDRAFAGQRVSYELRRRIGDEAQYYAVTYEPTTMEGCEPAVIVVITDITPIKEAETALHEFVRFAQSTTDALSSEVCVLDSAGTILSTNLAWRKFAELNGPPGRQAGTGDNYLHVCDIATGPGAAEAAASAKGIRAVLRGGAAQFTMEYDCHSPWENRWFVMRVTRFPGEGPVRVAVAHEDITERKQAETVLRESNRRFQEMLENVQLIAMTLDREGKITFCNDFLLSLTGWSHEEIIGQEWFSNFLPDSAARVKALFLENVETGTIPAHHQNPIKTRTGELRLIAWNNTMLRDDAGNFTGTASIGEDVTDRVRAEEALRASEMRLRKVLDSMFAFVGLFSLDGRVLEMNNSPLRLSGLRREDVIGRPFVETEWWAHSAAVREQLRRAMERAAGGETVREDFLVCVGDDRMLTIDTTFGPLRDDAGRVTQVVASAVDVTARIHAEEARRESELRLRQVVENIHEVFWMTDPDKKKIIYISPGYERIWGRTCESLQNSPDEWTRAIHPEDRERVQRAAATQQVDGAYDQSYRIVKPDGGIRWIRDRAFPVRDENGVVYRIAGVAEDITERKQLEEQFPRA